MRSILIFIFILSTSSVAHAQYHSDLRDSLQNIVATSTQLNERIEAILALSSSYIYEDPDSALIFANQASSVNGITESPDYSIYIARAAYYKASSYFYKGMYEEAENNINSGLAVISDESKQTKIEGDLYRVYGILNGATGSYESSIDYFLQAQHIYKALNLESEEQAILNNIGVTRMQLKDYDAAREIFESMRGQNPKDPRVKFSVPANLAFIYFEQGMIDEAEKMIEEALTLQREYLSSNPGLHYLIGEVALNKSDFNKAREAFIEAVNGYDRFGNTIQKVRPLLGLAKLNRMQGNQSEALMLMNQAKDIAESSMSYPELSDVYEYLYKYHKERLDFSDALRYLEKWKSVSDSLKNSRISEEIGKLTASFEFSEREQQMIKAKQQQEYEAALVLQRQRLALYGFVIVLVFAVGIIILQRRIVSHRKKTNELLNMKNTEIMEQAERLNQTNKVKDHLFSIIAHDLRGPLSSLHGMLTLIEMNATDEEELTQVVTEVDHQFQHTSTLLTNLLNWSQTQMDGYVVKSAFFDLQSICKSKEHLFKDRLNEKDIDFKYPAASLEVYADKDMIDLILQNLISNAIKFSSRGDHIYIEYHKDTDKDCAVVRVVDSGTGMTNEAIERVMSDEFFSTRGTNDEKGTGLGLMLCKDFISRNGGDFRIISSPGKGTTFEFTLALRP